MATMQRTFNRHRTAAKLTGRFAARERVARTEGEPRVANGRALSTLGAKMKSPRAPKKPLPRSVSLKKSPPKTADAAPFPVAARSLVKWAIASLTALKVPRNDAALI